MTDNRSIHSIRQDDHSKVNIADAESTIDNFTFKKPKLDRDPHCLYYIRKMQGWKSFIFLLTVGTIIFGTPAIVLLILDHSNLPSMTERNIDLLTRTEAQAVRFSLWAVSTWLLFVFSWFFLTLLPGIIVYMITLFIGSCSTTTRVRLSYIPALQIPAIKVIIAAGSSILFKVFFNQLDEITHWNAVFRILLVSTAFSIVFFIQRIFIHKFAINFHKISYQDRIESSKKELIILENLQRAIKNFSIAKIFDLDIFDTTNQSEQDVPSRSKNDSTSESFIEKELSLHESGKDKSRTKVPKSSLMEFSSDQYAVHLGKKLFNALCPKHCSEITINDFRKYFDNDDDAKEAIDLFDRDGNGSINQEEMVSIVKRIMITYRGIYKEKRDLEHSISDISHALGNFNNILSGVSFIVGLVASLPIYGVPLNAILPFTSILVAGSFIFGIMSLIQGGSAKATFDSMVFLFITHPYDAGTKFN
jgi:hypothetical protein